MSAWLISAAGVAVALILAFVQGRLSGARAQRQADLAREAQTYETHLQEIAAAAAARNAVLPDSMPDDDKYRRD